MTTPPIRVLVVDDQALVRTGFRLIVDAEPDLTVVGEAADGFEAVAQARALRPHVVLMDVRMPRMDGIEATGLITAPASGAADDRPLPRVLVVTTFDVDEHVYDAVRQGASGFLLKDTPPEDLVRAIRVVAAGDALLGPSATRALVEAFADGAGAVPRPAPPALDLLTAREREVLLLIAAGASNTEIAAQLIVSETTVKTHVGRIFTKLGLRDRVQAVVLAYEQGLVVPGQG